MTSPYLENEPRELSDVVYMREWGDPTDLGIPSDSPYEGTGMSPSTAQPVRYPTLAYVPTRFGTRTICDLPDNYDDPYEAISAWQAQADGWWRMLRTIAIAALAAGAVAMLVWDRYNPPPRQAVPMVTGFEGGQ